MKFILIDSAFCNNSPENTSPVCHASTPNENYKQPINFLVFDIYLPKCPD
jgi:hypothetical protein